MIAQSRGWLWIGTLVLLLAAILRLVGVSHGQPNPRYLPSTVQRGYLHEQAAVHPDEYFYVAIPVQMVLERRANPNFFENPSFLINLNALTFWVTNASPNRPDEAIPLRSLAPFHLYVIGRVYSALGGLLAVSATAAAGRLLGGRFAGIVAGGGVALSFPMVQHAHYATTSSLAAGFVAICLWACLAALRGRGFKARMLLIAAICAGLAAGNRYNAAAATIIVLVAGFIAWRRYPTRRTLGYVGLSWAVCPLVFVLTSPYIVLDFPQFWDDFTMISARFSGLDGLSHAPSNGLWLEYRYIIILGLGAPSSLLAVLGLWQMWRHKLWVGLSLVFSYVIPYSVVVLRTAVPHIGDQLTVPIIPFGAILAGMGAVVVARWLGRILVLAFAWAVPFSLSLTIVFLFTQPDTREVAAQWINEHLPQGARVHLLGPYNVALDSALYRVQQTFAGSMPPIARLQERSIEYLVVSDAWPFFDNRKQEYVPESARQAMNDYFASISANLTLLYEAKRPQWPGYDWLTNNASYWHHPTIQVYCLIEAACRAIR